MTSTILQQQRIVVMQGQRSLAVNQLPPQVIKVPQAPRLIVQSAPPRIISVGLQGPQGATGPAGPQGPPGSAWNYVLINSPGTYSLFPTDNYLRVDCTLGNILLVLVDANTQKGLTFKIKCVGISPSTWITIQPQAGQTIDGQAEIYLDALDDCYELVANGVRPNCNYDIT